MNPHDDSERDFDRESVNQEGENPGPDAVPAVDAKPLMEWEEYRHTGPGDLVEEDGTVMSGPAGAPQDDLNWRERRELSRKLGTDPRAPNPARKKA